MREIYFSASKFPPPVILLLYFPLLFHKCASFLQIFHQIVPLNRKYQYFVEIFINQIFASRWTRNTTGPSDSRLCARIILHHRNYAFIHEKEKEKQGDLVIGEYQGWMNVWRADIKFDIYPRSSDERFPSRSGDSCHAQLSCFKDFSSTVCIDARCAFNEPYRYAWSSEMTLVSALECSHVARAFLVSNVSLAETFLRDEKERPRALNFNPFKLSFVICRN